MGDGDVPSDDQPKAMDVHKPGSTLPSGNSRPVLGGHGPMVQDPTLRQPKPKKDDEHTPNEMLLRAEQGNTTYDGKDLQPLHDMSEVSEPGQEPSDAPQEEHNEPEASDDDEQKPQTSDSAGLDVLTKAAEDKKQNKKAEDDVKQNETVQKLIDSKQFYVPLAHDSTKTGGNHKLIFIILGLLVALGAAAFVLYTMGYVQL